MVRRFE